MNAKRGARRIEIVGLVVGTGSFLVIMIAPFLGGILMIGIGVGAAIFAIGGIVEGFAG